MIWCGEMIFQTWTSPRGVGGGCTQNILVQWGPSEEMIFVMKANEKINKNFIRKQKNGKPAKVVIYNLNVWLLLLKRDYLK